MFVFLSSPWFWKVQNKKFFTDDDDDDADADNKLSECHKMYMSRCQIQNLTPKKCVNPLTNISFQTGPIPFCHHKTRKHETRDQKIYMKT